MHQTSIKVCAPAHAECRGSKPEHPRGCRRQCPPRAGCLASWPEPIVQSLCLVIPPTFFESRCMRVASLSHICPLSPTTPEPTGHISPQGHVVLHQSRTHQGYKEATVSPDSRDQPSFPLPPSHVPLQTLTPHTMTMWLAFSLPVIFIGYILVLIHKLEDPSIQRAGQGLRPQGLRPSRRQEKRTAKLVARRDKNLPRDALILATNTPRDSLILA